MIILFASYLTSIGTRHKLKLSPTIKQNKTTYNLAQDEMVFEISRKYYVLNHFFWMITS